MEMAAVLQVRGLPQSLVNIELMNASSFPSSASTSRPCFRRGKVSANKGFVAERTGRDQGFLMSLDPSCSSAS